MPFLESLKSKFGSIKGKKEPKEPKEKKSRKSKDAATAAAAVKEEAEGKKDEVHILPVPGNTNEPPETGGGLNSNPAGDIHKGLGPVIPSQETANNLGEPATREELRARAAALNAE